MKNNIILKKNEGQQCFLNEIDSFGIFTVLNFKRFINFSVYISLKYICNKKCSKLS